MIEDTELREILRATAANATLPAEMPQPMRRKVTRRRARAIGITCLVSVGIAIGALQGMQAVTLDDAARIPPADKTEDKDPRAVTYSFLDGEVSLHAAEPWTEYFYPRGECCDGTGESNKLWAGGPALVFDQKFVERLELDDDPRSVGTACQPGMPPVDAEALVREIRSYTDLKATAPVRVSVGGVGALRMDVTTVSGATPCSKWGAYPPTAMVLRQENHGFRGAALEEGSRMRLYLLDAPEGLSSQILALWIVAPETRFEHVAEAAQPILDSIEFHAP